MENSVFLTKEALLEVSDLLIEKVELSRGHVFVREMTGHEKDLWESSMLKKIPMANGKVSYETTLDDFRAKLAVVTLCDADGKLLFEMKDVKALNRVIRASDIEKIVEVAQRINAISDKDKDEILKNSQPDLEGDSTSSSVEN